MRNIEFSNFTFILFAIIVLLILYVFIKGKVKGEKLIYIALFVIYLIFLINITIFPITVIKTNDTRNIFDNYFKQKAYYQFIPFKTILNVGNYNFFRQVICNILLFMPLSFFIKIIFNKLSAIKIILIGIFSSLIIELLQLLINLITNFPSYVCDIDDLILNSIGVVIGYMISLLFLKLKNIKKEGIK